MNVMFVINDNRYASFTLIPFLKELQETLFITLAKEADIIVEERPISVDELKKLSSAKQLHKLSGLAQQR